MVATGMLGIDRLRNIGTRIFLGFVPIMFLLVLVSMIGFSALRSDSANLSAVSEAERQKSTIAALEVEILKLRSDILVFVQHGNVSALDEADERLASARTIIRGLLANADVQVNDVGRRLETKIDELGASLDRAEKLFDQRNRLVNLDVRRNAAMLKRVLEAQGLRPGKGAEAALTVKRLLESQVKAGEFFSAPSPRLRDAELTMLAELEVSIRDLLSTQAHPPAPDAAECIETFATYRTAFEMAAAVSLEVNYLTTKIIADQVAALLEVSASASAEQDRRIHRIDEETRQSLVTNGWMMTLGAGSAFAAGSVVAWLIGRSLARPIRQMTEVMTSLAAGNIYINIPAQKLCNELGAMAHAVKVFRDNAARMIQIECELLAKAAELQQANAALRQSNTDLERFAYVASHDLQTPLRNIVSFSQLLDLHHKDRLNEEAREFLGFIIDAGHHMSRLVNDLLQYARVTSQGKSLSSVSAEAAITVALGNLSCMVRECDATITVAPLPQVMADETQLVSLFQNLIENAMKYRHPDRRPDIHVYATPYSSHRWQISVADNGVGIDAPYQRKIFEIFQRLHPSRENDGSGIGLTICQRIVTRFGGEIWVESSSNAGSIFHFTIEAPGA